MKIPQSVRVLYSELRPTYGRLKDRVDGLIRGCLDRRWHYESRLKEEQSFALKLEMGRELRPERPDDFFAATIVVENHSRISDAEKLIGTMFATEKRRPKTAENTHLRPQNFEFDDLRLYVTLQQDPRTRPNDLTGLLFEVQIKTFLQHAWGIATHDLVYKTDEVGWGATRVAYQVKAMLENAELSISEAKHLKGSSILNRTDFEFKAQATTVQFIKARWNPESLPVDLARLASNILNLAALFQLENEDLWVVLDSATAQGRGAKLLNLSPYAAVLQTLIEAKGPAIFNALKFGKRSLFVPDEIELPALPREIQAKIIRPRLPAIRPRIDMPAVTAVAGVHAGADSPSPAPAP